MLSQHDPRPPDPPTAGRGGSSPAMALPALKPFPSTESFVPLSMHPFENYFQDPCDGLGFTWGPNGKNRRQGPAPTELPTSPPTSLQIPQEVVSDRAPWVSSRLSTPSDSRAACRPVLRRWPGTLRGEAREEAAAKRKPFLLLPHIPRAL